MSLVYEDGFELFVAYDNGHDVGEMFVYDFDRRGIASKGLVCSICQLNNEQCDNNNVTSKTSLVDIIINCDHHPKKGFSIKVVVSYSDGIWFNNLHLLQRERYSRQFLVIAIVFYYLYKGVLRVLLAIEKLFNTLKFLRMAMTCRLVSSNLIILSFSLLVLPCLGQGQGSFCPFEAIYQFGDSISDTGNIDFINHQGKCSKDPFGETSNIPLAAALMLRLFGSHFYFPIRINLPIQVMGSTLQLLEAQLWTLVSSKKEMLLGQTLNITDPLACSLTGFKSTSTTQFAKRLHPVVRVFYVTECATKLIKALFLMGEIGFNDFNWPFNSGTKIEGLATYIPPVVQAVSGAVKEVIRQGAVRIVVSGLFPMGCVPFYHRNATYLLLLRIQHNLPTLAIGPPLINTQVLNFIEILNSVHP
ncbi:GDSL lipase/esterase [Dillenia turbinata]|uniref:GDSL lipase/esterase n=1 Tax=Dillenia turbinata TaxID=194707 RepID=A0AAN8ZB63_9MAGN